jgi:hypothetical protein
VASQRVEDTRSVRGLQVGEDEEAAWSGGDDIVLAEQREVLPADAARDGVDHQARVCLEDLVNDDPPPRAETEVEEIAFGVFRGGAPAGADGAEVHVAVYVVGGEEEVGDVAEELGREGRPVRPHGQREERLRSGEVM